MKKSIKRGNKLIEKLTGNSQEDITKIIKNCFNDIT